MTTLLTLTAILWAAAEDPKPSPPPRKPSAVAPSLPELTDEEEEQLDRIIDRFIAYDTGRLPGEEGKKALKEFQKLGPEAIPALIRGMNKAALIDHSCPAVVIAQKLHKMLMASNDLELLEFARENIGLGVTRSRHAGVLQDLRVACTLRKGQVQRQKLAAAQGPKAPRLMSVADLAAAAGSDRGERLKQILLELGRRQGDEAIAALGAAAAASYEDDVKALAREQLVKLLSRQTANVLRDKLKDDRVEVRVAAARVAGEKKLRLGGELIDLLDDSEARVREAAHQALVRLNGGTDLGTGAEATAKWRAWWKQQ